MSVSVLTLSRTIRGTGQCYPKHPFLLIGLLWIVVVPLLSGCTQSPAQPPYVFVTDKGIGPDKWASAWLITRHAAPGAIVEFRETSTGMTGGIAFDVPDADYKRTAQGTTFEALVAGYRIDDASLLAIGGVIREMEIDSWSKSPTGIGATVEQAYRGLQFRYGRESVPAACYYRLFDALEQYLRAHAERIDTRALQGVLAQEGDCAFAGVDAARENKFVPEWRTDEILAFLRAGKRLVFVDTREPDEYREGHIPGAINIQMRDIDGPLPQAVLDADVVVPYCVKDFRGFEVAKRLKLRGIRHVGLMNPYGISGWRKAGLPVAGPNDLSEPMAADKLKACVAAPKACVKNV